MPSGKKEREKNENVLHFFCSALVSFSLFFSHSFSTGVSFIILVFAHFTSTLLSLMYISSVVSLDRSRTRYVIRYPRNSPRIVSGAGGFHDMYIDVADVLCAIIVTGFPVGAATKKGYINETGERNSKRKKEKIKNFSLCLTETKENCKWKMSFHLRSLNETIKYDSLDGGLIPNLFTARSRKLYTVNGVRLVI